MLVLFHHFDTKETNRDQINPTRRSHAQRSVKSFFVRAVQKMAQEPQATPGDLRDLFSRREIASLLVRSSGLLEATLP